MSLFKLLCYWSTFNTVYLVVDLASTSGTPSASLYGSVYGYVSGPDALTHEEILKNYFQNVYSSSVLFIVLYTVFLLSAELTSPLPASAGFKGLVELWLGLLSEPLPFPLPFPLPYHSALKLYRDKPTFIINITPDKNKIQKIIK